MVATKRRRAHAKRPALLNEADWMALFDQLARDTVSMSGDEFIRRLRAGEFGDPDERPEIMRLALLIPHGR